MTLSLWGEIHPHWFLLLHLHNQMLLFSPPPPTQQKRLYLLHRHHQHHHHHHHQHHYISTEVDMCCCHVEQKRHPLDEPIDVVEHQHDSDAMTASHAGSDVGMLSHSLLFDDMHATCILSFWLLSCHQMMSLMRK